MQKLSLTNTTIALIAVLLLALTFMVGPAMSAPAEQANLLRNGDFESEFYAHNGDDARHIPNEWGAWWDNAKAPPKYNAAEVSHRVQSGYRAMSFWEQYLDFDGGVNQIVNGITPGSILRFQAYGQAWSTTDTGSGSSDTDVFMQIGIDPNGGTNPFDAGVVWSGGGNPRDAYQLFQVETTANHTQITVFLRGKTTFAVTQTDIYWDNASLVVVGQAAATDTPPDAAPTKKPASSGVPAGSIPKSTPGPDGSVFHVVKSGETLIGISITYNVPIAELLTLNNIASANFIYVGQKLVIKLPGGAAPPAEETEEATDDSSDDSSDDSGDDDGGDSGEDDSGGDSADDSSSDDSGGDAGGSADTGSDVAEATGNGTICIMGFGDTNVNGIRDAGEAAIADVTFAVTDGTNTVGSYTSNGTEPYCFSDLTPGSYVVSWTGDASFTATTENIWAASVAAGSTVSHEFGIQGEAEGGTDDSGSDASGSSGGILSSIPKWVIPLVGGLGAIFFLTGLGAAGYFFLIRRGGDIGDDEDDELDFS